MKHSVQKGWHRYDFLLTGGYGWDYILNTAQYLMDSDLDVRMVEKTMSLGSKPVSIFNEVKEAGSIKNCASALAEGSSFSIGGGSKELGCIVMISFTNQTSVLTVFTMAVDKSDVIENYVEKLIIHKFKKNNVNKGNGFLGILSWVLIDLGALFLISGFLVLIAAGLWSTFLVSAFGGLIVLDLGVYIKAKNKPKFVKEEIKKNPVIEVKKKEEPVEILDNEPYLIISGARPVRPYMDEIGRAFLVRGKADAKDKIKEVGLPFLNYIPYSSCENYFETMMNVNGFSGVVNDGKFEEKIEHLGSRLERVLYQIMQKNSFPKYLTKELLNEDELEILRNEINNVPLMLAFVYDGENPMEPIYDGKLHMTPKAHDLFVKLEDKGTYYGIDRLCPGKEIVIIRQDGMIAYYGDKEVVKSDKDGGVMHPRVAENHMAKLKALAVYTNMDTLKTFFKNTRVAIFTYDDLADHIKETDGLMIDLGNYGIGAMLDKPLCDELANIRLSSFNNSLN